MGPWLALLAVLTTADYIVTRRFLALGQVEANPVLRWVIERWGPPGLAAAKLASFATVAGIGYRYGIFVPVLQGICAAYGAAIAWNVYKIRSAK